MPSSFIFSNYQVLIFENVHYEAGNFVFSFWILYDIATFNTWNCLIVPSLTLSTVDIVYKKKGRTNPVTSSFANYYKYKCIWSLKFLIVEWWVNSFFRFENRIYCGILVLTTLLAISITQSSSDISYRISVVLSRL